MEAKGNIIKGFPQRFQRVSGVAGQVGNIFQYDLPLDEWTASLERLATITPEQATEAARDHLNPDAVVIVIVGDKKVIEAGIEELGLGEVQTLAATEEE